MTIPEHELPFSLEWLVGAATKRAETLSVCDLGHLVVQGRTHWQPDRLSADLKTVWFRWIIHEDTP